MPRQKVDHEQFKRIKRQLPYLNKLFEEEDENIKLDEKYKECAICIFKDWLSEEDAHLVFTEDINEIKSRRKKFKSFVKSLFESTDIFILTKMHSKKGSYIYKPSDLNYLMKMCEFDKLTEDRGEQYTLLIPEYSAIYRESYDWTNILYYRDWTKAEALTELANKHGLHRIEF
jgi:hypothetical protein